MIIGQTADGVKISNMFGYTFRVKMSTWYFRKSQVPLGVLLRAGPFSILGAVGVLEDVVFAHRVYPQQLPAGAGRRNELAGRVGADIVDSVHEKSIGLRPLAGHREGRPGAVVDVGAVIHGARVQRQELIEAAPVKRQVLDLALRDQARGRV